MRCAGFHRPIYCQLFDFVHMPDSMNLFVEIGSERFNTIGLRELNSSQRESTGILFSRDTSQAQEPNCKRTGSCRLLVRIRIRYSRIYADPDSTRHVA